MYSLQKLNIVEGFELDSFIFSANLLFLLLAKQFKFTIKLTQLLNFTRPRTIISLFLHNNIPIS